METIVPSNDDVLMGRGGKNNQHIGNERLREMARARAADYKAADKKEKSEISLDLIRQVHANGGRFLKRDPVSMQWHLVPVELSRVKASQCCRDAVSMKKRRSSGSSSTSSSTTEGAGQKTDTQTANTRPQDISFSSAEPVQPKRKATIDTPVDMNVTCRKRRRVSEEPVFQLEKEQGTPEAPIAIIADAVLADLFASNNNNETNNRSNLLDDFTEPRFGFDFELFDCDSLVSDESLSDDCQLE